MKTQLLKKTSFSGFVKTLLIMGLASIIGSMNIYAAAVVPSASTTDFHVLHNFDNTNGTPSNGVTQDTDGNLYGAAFGGLVYYGLVYKLDANGNYSVLHRFCEEFCGDGDTRYPDGAITILADGSLVGTTAIGGLSYRASVYKIDVNGVISILNGGGYHESLPGPLALGRDGSLYGTVSVDIHEQGNLGSVYKIDPSGKVSELHVFGKEYVNVSGSSVGRLYQQIGLPGGGNPSEGVTLGTDGSLYGTTSIGGTLKKDFFATPQGVVYKLNALGVFSVVHSFDDPINGTGPSSRVIVASDGSLFGTTASGGRFGHGVIYKIAPDGAYNVLHNFDSYNLEIPGQDIEYWFPDIVMGNDGSIYGTIFAGGRLKFGIVYKLDPNGNYSVLHDFDKTNGAGPNGISFGRDGKLYGTTAYGGKYGFGTVFSMSLPPVKATTLSTLSTNVSTAVFGQPVSLKVVVTTSNPTPFGPTGMVSLMDGSGTLCSAKLSGNTATCTTASLSVGTHTISARYTGDSKNATSVSDLVTLVISPVNAAPVAVNDAFMLAKHRKNPITVAAPGVLGNDTDSDGNKLTVVGATATTPRTITLAGGSVALYADGHFVYTQSKDKEGFKGTTSFTYQATDGQANSNIAMVALTMTHRSKEHNRSDKHHPWKTKHDDHDRKHKKMR